LTETLKGETLVDEVVLVTGGGSGLGHAVAELAAAAGAVVNVLDLRAERVDAVVSELRDGGARAHGIAADISDEAQVRDAVAAVVRRHGRLDVLVNSAGIFERGPFVDTPMDVFDRVYATNVRGTFMMCREVARVMLRQSSGYIINVSSISGKRGSTNEAAYASGKWALVGLGECLALELGSSGIRVTTVCPSGMDTTFWENDPRDRSNWRLISAAHVARAIVDLASLPPEVVVKEAVITGPGR
jgi:NAD(P)-dependent dehydrogenase (short-subunit alcohol dehydrogenase family)